MQQVQHFLKQICTKYFLFNCPLSLTFIVMKYLWFICFVFLYLDFVRTVHTSFDKSDTTFPGADSIEISFWSDTQGGSHRLASSLQNMYSPLSLFHMFKVLTLKENKSTIS